jgi:hypothetical protein
MSDQRHSMVLSGVGDTEYVIRLGWGGGLKFSFSEYFPFSWEIYGNVTHAKLLFMNATCATAWTLIAYYMYICDFFIKI